MRRASPEERSEDVELSAIQAEVRERCGELGLKKARCAEQATDDGDRGGIQVGAHGGPLVEQSVDVIWRHDSSILKLLTSKFKLK
jgi:hypothetical protein